MIEMLPKQLEAYHVAINAVDNNKCFQAIVGQRAGKDNLLYHLALQYSDKNLLLVSCTMAFARSNFPEHKDKIISIAGLLAMFKNKEEREILRKSIIIIDECEWIKEYPIIVQEALQLNVPLIATSSNGPFKAEENENIVTVRAATWDWNPAVLFTSLIPQFTIDFDKAANDFGLYDAHTTDLEAVMRKFGIKARNLRRKGWTYVNIANKFNVSELYVHRAVNTR